MATTVPAGSSATISLANGQYVVLNTNPGTEGTISINPASGGGSIRDTQTTVRFGPPHLLSRQFGPYATPVTMVISDMRGGDLTYDTFGTVPANALTATEVAAAKASSGSVGSGLGGPDYLFNFKRSNTRWGRFGIEVGGNPLVLAPTISSIACIGDSITFGSNSGAGTSNPATADSMRCSYPRRMLDQLVIDLANSGAISNYNAAFANVTPTTGDNRRPTTLPTGMVAGDVCPGGSGLKWPSAGDVTGTYSIAFLEAFDIVDVWYKRLPTAGSFTIGVDGGASLATVSTAGATGLAKYTTTAGAITLGVHTLNLARTTGTGDVEIIAVIPRNSTVRNFLALNMGTPGWTSTQWAVSTNAWSPLPAALAMSAPAQLNARTMILSLGINDQSDGYSSSLFISNMSSIISQFKALLCDVILKVPHPVLASGNITYATQSQCAADYYTLASTFDLPVIDNQKLFGPDTGMTPGVAMTADQVSAARTMLQTYLYNNDSIHNKAVFNHKDGRSVASALRGIL